MRPPRCPLASLRPCRSFQNSHGADWCREGFFYTGIAYLMDPDLSSDFYMLND